MHKTALTVTVTSIVLGIFAAFFRWLQNNNAFDPETGCAIAGHGTSIVFTVYCVLAVAAIVVLTIAWSRRYDCAKDAGALRCSTSLPIVLAWLFAAGFVVASCVMMFSADFARHPTAQRLLGAWGILAGLCLPFLPVKKDGSPLSLARTAAAVAALFFCYLLVYCYRIHSDDPVVWRFAVEIIAAAATAAAFYYAAAFHYGVGRGHRALIAVQLAVFFDIATLFDTRSTALSIMFLIAAAMLLVLEFLMIKNMWESRED